MSAAVAQQVKAEEVPGVERVFPNAAGGDREAGGGAIKAETESVEVVLGSQGSSDKVVDHSAPDQNVFRAPNPVRPRAVRAQQQQQQHGGPPPHPHVKTSGSYGYPTHGSEYGHPPYPVPYTLSNSFEDGGAGPYHHPPHSHYSPHVQYPPPSSRHPPEDVNVISPNHKDGGRHHAADPRTSRSRYGGGRDHYQYPPSSPVSRPGAPSSPPRMRNYGPRRPDAPYSSSSHRGRDESWGRGGHPTTDRSRPPLVDESSFDSEHYSSGVSSNPNTPNAPHYGPPIHGVDPNYSFSGGVHSFGGSFDSGGHAPPPPPPHFDDRRYYGHHPHHPPPASPYSQYSHHSHHGYSPGGYYDPYSPHPDYRYNEEGRYGEMHHAVSPNDSRGGKKDATSGMMLPQAASEIDFEVTDPPTEPVTPPSKAPVCESPGDVNSYDVLCGRGGGTNSQIGNRRFRKLVQDFQPIYLLARRKDKPLLARTIVLIIRKRGGRFLKKDDETGELYEVGDAKAEAKTSQALREGLDVRATKSAASSLMDKKKKKKKKDAKGSEEEEEPNEAEPSPKDASEQPAPPSPDAPPSLPRLNVGKPRSSSPGQQHYRKRRRMRSEDAADDSSQMKSGCGDIGAFQDKLFSDFCPPRADIGRASPVDHVMEDPMVLSHTPPRRGMRYSDDDIRSEEQTFTNDRGCASMGCAGIALDMVTGAAACGFTLGPRRWH